MVWLITLVQLGWTEQNLARTGAECERHLELHLAERIFLASLMSNTSKTTENSGDSTYDIDINVERIAAIMMLSRWPKRKNQRFNQSRCSLSKQQYAGLMR